MERLLAMYIEHVWRYIGDEYIENRVSHSRSVCCISCFTCLP